MLEGSTLIQKGWFKFSLILLLSSIHYSWGMEADYTLKDCLGRIQENSVQVAQAVVNEARSKAALEEADKPRLPQLVAQGDLEQSSNIYAQALDTNKAVIRIEQGTLPFGSAWRLGDQRKLELESSHFAAIESTQDVEQLVKDLYFSILQEQDLIAHYSQIESQFQKLLANVVPRFQIGRAPSFDLVKVKLAIYELKRTREITEAQLIGERSQLAKILGFKSPNFDLERLELIPSLPPGAFSQKSMDANPTLLVLQKDVEASKAAVSVATSARLPSLGLSAEYGLAGISPDTMVEAWTAMGSLRLTIFDWGLISSQVDQAKASVILAEKKQEAELQRISSEWAQTWALADAHFTDQKRLKALLPELDKTARVSIDRYRKAALGILEVTDAVSIWLQALTTERSDYYSYLADLAHLERLTGNTFTVMYEK